MKRRESRTSTAAFKLILCLSAGIFLALGMSPGFCADSVPQQLGNISIHVTNLRSSKGMIRYLLFNDETNYMTDKFTGEHAFKKSSAPIQGNEAVYTFKKIPYGEYTLKFFHDPDNSGQPPRGRFGGLKTEYGFSNNARGRFGPPNFENAKFNLQGSEIYMNIEAIK